MRSGKKKKKTEGSIHTSFSMINFKKAFSFLPQEFGLIYSPIHRTGLAEE